MKVILFNKFSSQATT